jgi:hypothetical protein
LSLYYEGLTLLETSFEGRLAVVESRIRKAVVRSGRDRQDISLVAVSKKFSAKHMEAAYQAGLRIFGENYVQEFAEKRPQLTGLEGARFHFIGHLQSNKAKLSCELFDCIQTVDSAKLLRRLDEAAGEMGKHLETMIEVKLSGEDSKAGTGADAISEILEVSAACRHVSVAGLMTMPPWSENAEDSRPYFKRLAALGMQHGLKQLSMGMSNDLEVAIEEGATLVRVGTALFGPRPKPAA